MARTRIDELTRLMSRAFDGGEHSLIDNLSTVWEESWDGLPVGATRSIREIVIHVGMFKYMYANHGFRDASMNYGDSPATPTQDRLESLKVATVWLHEAHTYLIDCISGLDSDHELDVPRKAHWGEYVPTHHLIVTMVEHDLYHAGEINRSRALLQNDDDWFKP